MPKPRLNLRLSGDVYAKLDEMTRRPGATKSAIIERPCASISIPKGGRAIRSPLQGPSRLCCRACGRITREAFPEGSGSCFTRRPGPVPLPVTPSPFPGKLLMAPLCFPSLAV